MTALTDLPARVATRTAAGADDAEQWTLLRRAQAGDTDAFAQIYQAQRHFVFAYLYRRVTNRHTAQDLTAETFARAWRSRTAVTHQRSEVNAWLVTIARNLLLDYRKAAARRECPTADADPGIDRSPRPEDAAVVAEAAREAAHAVRPLLAALTEDQRRCLFLKFWACLSNREIVRSPRSSTATRRR
ncbi:sigma-70 family RNA polymerase sigma factor [Amycolatopsis sp. K13G38]|uniref:Sigma-70 family RNA polymerase sigma factor n=1 Tax=Amycolatopsis acididurans TaxID=2724524 RepID=A0ABX1JJV3_9PSEU|nr:RNA polymerase sigma factor [Amycolatopsis acididurans]NKQ58750.1 sigma-70 family RNA polymerase sigma factor [Amycolatopsis acididurans]